MANLGYVQVTRACNQQCRFCSNPPIERAQTLETVARQIRDLKKRGYHGVILTGGEPTLAPFLEAAIEKAWQIGIEPRIITNGQLLADRKRVRALKRAGLRQLHISVHSCRHEVQAYLSQNPDSLENIRACLENVASVGLNADVNTVICAQNADHLDRTVDWFLTTYPFVHHFVFNNIDPQMNRCAENPQVIARLADFELSLQRALAKLTAKGCTFRVERVPLCYMLEHAAFSTETRKIVKNEERVVHFLDAHKGTVRQTEWTHGKAECCTQCTLNEICAGLYGMNKGFDPAELYPVFVEPKKIIGQILQP
jgi:MoaA/NifB/PqqE/SkfB family radical SAM enzyme